MLKSKYSIKLALAALTLFGVVHGTTALAATATASASATITDAPITITNSQPLAFGDIAAGNQASVVSIATDGTRTLESGDAILGANSGSAGVFNITGEASKAYTVTLPSTNVTINDNTGNSMTITDFVSNASGTVGSDGTDSFNVGAKLNVAANQPAGSYSGSFTVEVVY